MPRLMAASACLLALSHSCSGVRPSTALDATCSCLPPAKCPCLLLNPHSTHYNTHCQQQRCGWKDGPWSLTDHLVVPSFNSGLHLLACSPLQGPPPDPLTPHPTISSPIPLFTTTTTPSPPHHSYKIPRGFLFNFITCANYTAEVCGWLGYTVAVQSVAAGVCM